VFLTQKEHYYPHFFELHKKLHIRILNSQKPNIQIYSKQRNIQTLIIEFPEWQLGKIATQLKRPVREEDNNCDEC
jgi:hypothetical protein